MSRSGYVDECNNWDLIRWRGAVTAAIKGKKGQKLLKELAAALDAMPEKKLISGELETNDGVCALGCVGKANRLDMTNVDVTDREAVGKLFNIAPALAAEIAYMNDEYGWKPTPEERWEVVRKWVGNQIKAQQ